LPPVADRFVLPQGFTFPTASNCIQIVIASSCAAIRRFGDEKFDRSQPPAGMINNPLTLPLELNPAANGIFQSFALAFCR
jgi:hypothetical protein